MKEANGPSSPRWKGHPDIETLDRWRAGLLPKASAQEVAAHVQDCPDCRWSAAFATRLVTAWTRFEPAIQVRHSRRDRRQPAAWRLRAVLAGLVAASVLIAVQLLSGPGESTEALSAVQGPPEQEVIGHLRFYEWLADHPEKMQQVSHDF